MLNPRPFCAAAASTSSRAIFRTAATLRGGHASNQESQNLATGKQLKTDEKSHRPTPMFRPGAERPFGLRRCHLARDRVRQAIGAGGEL